MDELWSSRHLGNWTHPLTTLLKRSCAWSVPQGPDSGEGSLTLPTMNRCRHHIRMPRPGRRMRGRYRSCEESPPGGKKDCSSLALLAMTAANKKALANCEGLSVTSIFAIQI